ETLRLDAARMPFLAHLYEMMTGTLGGDWSALEADFRVSREGDVVVLSPYREGTPLPMIRARIGETVETVEMVRPSGDRDRLDFDHQRIDTAPLSPAEDEIFRAAGK